MKLIRRSTFVRMRRRLESLYGEDMGEQLSERLYLLMGRYGVAPKPGASYQSPKWDEKDSFLITYGDMVQKEGQKPLKTLRQFCKARLKGAINGVHVLPFCPSSSDGGFSVKDYRKVDDDLGKWGDLEALGREYKLMSDLVLNHCSRRSKWFQDYVNGIAPYRDYFIEANCEDERLQDVTRPRPWPLLSRTETSQGERWVWTTFSRDQVDLNWECQDVLFEMLDILLFYVSKGIKVVRLDAVAFLWKELGTNCMHLPQTHEVVKLFRDVLLSTAPDVILLTETNVPHEENISYFGDGDEAQMVYQFALPPLLLHGLLRNDSRYLQKWAKSLQVPPEGCTYFNFTASHDGVGVRPLKGLVPDAELDWLVEQTKQRGGLVGMRSMPDGSESPYELNITYRSALAKKGAEEVGNLRFLCSQAIMLSLQGVPGIYFHSLVGELNWNEGPELEGGEKRDINRRRWNLEALDKELEDEGGSTKEIFNSYTKMLQVRSTCAAFHPDGSQEILEVRKQLFALVRTSPDGKEKVLCCFNFTDKMQEFPQKVLGTKAEKGKIYEELFTGQQIDFLAGTYTLSPYGFVWIKLS